MRKFLLALVAFFFTVPAFAAPSLWLCSNSSASVFLMIGYSLEFYMFDKNGGFMATGSFTTVEPAAGFAFQYAEVNGIGMGLRKMNDGSVVLVLNNTQTNATARLDCK